MTNRTKTLKKTTINKGFAILGTSLILATNAYLIFSFISMRSIDSIKRLLSMNEISYLKLGFFFALLFLAFALNYVFTFILKKYIYKNKERQEMDNSFGISIIFTYPLKIIGYVFSCAIGVTALSGVYILADQIITNNLFSLDQLYKNIIKESIFWINIAIACLISLVVLIDITLSIYNFAKKDRVLEDNEGQSNHSIFCLTNLTEYFIDRKEMIIINL